MFVRVGPLVVDCGFDLPECEPVDGPCTPDVVVSRGVVEGDLPGGQAITAVAQVSDDACQIVLPDLLTMRIEGGRRITLQWDDATPLADVRALMFSTGFAALYLQRGLLPLHASALVTNQGLVAFTGVSGAGKSTTAALLGARGHTIFTDDVCVLDGRTPGGPLAHQHLRVHKLCADVAGRLPGAVLDRGRSSIEAKEYRPIAGSGGRGIAIARLYLLAQRPEPGPPAFERLYGQQAVAAALATGFRPGLVRGLGRQGDAFELLTRLAQEIPIYRLTRSMDLDDSPAFADALEAHMAGSDARATA